MLYDAPMARRDDVPEGATERVPRRSGGGEGWSLLVLSDSGMISEPLPSAGSVVIGRGDEADVRIADASVSRSHARLELGDEPAIVDLGSANGVWVRGRKLDDGERAPIAPGELVELGTVRVAVQWGDARASRDGWIEDARGRAVLPAVARRDEADASIVAEDPGTLRVLELVRRVAASKLTVLLIGETGVGKEVIASAIHRASDRNQGPLLELNCAAIAPSLLESELFGHERGAFTGATDARAGLVESANGGTLFLDEVGELPLDLQPKLLRVLEEREVIRIGGRRAQAVDVRFVAATNRDLAAEASRGTFRRDLYYRLNGITIRIPPLRERPLDILPLARRFAGDKAVSDGAASVLLGHDWPGNVRELRNAIDRAILLSGNARELRAEHIMLDATDALPESMWPAVDAPRPSVGDAGNERARIEDALARCGGNQTRAAEMLGISRRTLVNWLEKHGIARPRKG